MTEEITEVTSIYAARIGDALQDSELVLNVWQGALSQGSREHAAKYAWFHRHCPSGPTLLALIDHTPTAACVGTSAVGLRRMLWRGQEIRAGVMADMAISPQHRTLGPVLTLQAKLLDAAHGRFDWLYGFPNAKSIAVAKRAGFPVIGQLCRYSRILRHGEYLRRVMPRLIARPLGWLLDMVLDVRRWLGTHIGARLIAEWSNSVDSGMDQLWRESKHGDGLIAVRDSTFLRWRFDEYPGASTRYLTLREQKAGPLLGWFACQVDGTTLQVRDFWSRDAAEGLPKSHIEALLRAARLDSSGHAAVSVEYAAATSKLAGWLAAGFTERARRSVIGRALTEGCGEMSDLHLTAADEDE
jgi:hypothetical protein